MYNRFPELVPPEVSGNPTLAQIESGEWCFPGFRPDESNVTMLDPSLPAASQFASAIPKYLWLQNNRQTIVAVSGNHPHNPNDPFYDDLRSLYGHFVAETNGQERVTLREGRKWPEIELKGSDADIITKGGDGLYLQALASGNDVECLSTEPVKDGDILAVMRGWPELSRAASMYVKMRMLPQAFRSQQQDPLYRRLPVHHYLGSFMEERRRHHGKSWAANHLYSGNPFLGPGCLDPIGLHLTKAHGLYGDKGRRLWGYEIAESPTEEVLDQVFRCTNSPVFHAGDVTYNDLCEVQRVAVPVNRLRDRRTAYLLADLGRRAVSFFWMSGPNHYEALLPGLRGLAAEQALSSRDMQAQLGLLAVRSDASA